MGHLKFIAFAMIAYSLQAVAVDEAPEGNPHGEAIERINAGAGPSVPFDGNNLKMFTSDGCSAVPEEAFREKDLMQRCCLFHDIEYWLGGDRNERLAADLKFKSCLIGAGVSRLVANSFFAAVRIGGYPGSGQPYQWGFGWETSPRYESRISMHSRLPQLNPLVTSEFSRVVQEIPLIEEDSEKIENLFMSLLGQPQAAPNPPASEFVER